MAKVYTRLVNPAKNPIVRAIKCAYCGKRLVVYTYDKTTGHGIVHKVASCRHFRTVETHLSMKEIEEKFADKKIARIIDLDETKIVIVRR